MIFFLVSETPEKLLKSLIKIDFSEAKVVYDQVYKIINHCIINKVHCRTSFLLPFSLAFYPSMETVSLYMPWNVNQSS